MELIQSQYSVQRDKEKIGKITSRNSEKEKEPITYLRDKSRMKRVSINVSMKKRRQSQSSVKKDKGTNRK